MVRIGFRVDGGAIKGIGHIMRCLALADAFPEDNIVTFIVKKEESVLKLLNSKKYNTVQLKEYISYEDEISEVKKVIKENNIDILITDSYKIDQHYLAEIKREVKKLVSIHDSAPFPFPSHAVINGNIYAPELNYESADGDTEFLLGTEYTLLRKEFQDLPERKINKEVTKILVTVGGYDTLNLTPKIVKAIKQAVDGIKDIHADIVIGPSFANEKEILDEIERSGLDTDVHYNPENMRELMMKNDIAVTAGGSTLYELAATGTPAIVLIQADNQIPVTEGMERSETVINCGYGNKIRIDELSIMIKGLALDHRKRIRMGQIGQGIIKGNGPSNCVGTILK